MRTRCCYRCSSGSLGPPKCLSAGQCVSRALQLHSSKGPCHVGPLCPGRSRGKQPDSPGPDPVTEGCHFILCPQPGPVTEGHCLTLYRWPEQRLSRDVPLTWLAQRWLLVTQTSLPSRSPFLQPQVEVRQGTTLTVMYLNCFLPPLWGTVYL